MTRLPASLADLVLLRKVDVIAAQWVSRPLRAAAKRHPYRTIPIVLCHGRDPGPERLVPALARSGRQHDRLHSDCH